MEINLLQKMIIKGSYVYKIYKQSQEKQKSEKCIKKWVAKIHTNTKEGSSLNLLKWVKWIHNPAGLVHCLLA